MWKLLAVISCLYVKCITKVTFPDQESVTVSVLPVGTHCLTVAAYITAYSSGESLTIPIPENYPAIILAYPDNSPSIIF